MRQPPGIPCPQVPRPCSRDLPPCCIHIYHNRGQGVQTLLSVATETLKSIQCGSLRESHAHKFRDLVPEISLHAALSRQQGVQTFRLVAAETLESSQRGSSSESHAYKLRGLVAEIYWGANN